MEHVNYYELLGVEITATEKEIKYAYRKKALAVHPDKNPSPDAAALFHALTQAQDLLLDPTKRSNYDNIHRTRLANQKKKQEMDSKRRNAQDELERLENEAKRSKTDQRQAKAQYDAEIARLREEGAKRRQEDWNAENTPKEEELPEETVLDCVLKLKWKKKRFDLSEQDLEDLLDPIGKVDTVKLSEKKKGSAIVVFKTVVDAYTIITKKDTHPALSKFESIDWVTGKAPALVERMARQEEMKKEARAALFSTNNRSTAPIGKTLFSTGDEPSFFKPLNIPAFKMPTSSISDNDYESITLMKMRQAEKDRLLLLSRQKEQEQH